MMTDKQLVRFAAQFRKGMLGKESSHRRCAMVSWPLASLLSASGVECRTVEGDLGFCNHVWIELEDGRVLDATLDQFNDPPGFVWPAVYLGPATFLHPKTVGAKTAALSES